MSTNTASIETNSGSEPDRTASLASERLAERAHETIDEVAERAAAVESSAREKASEAGDRARAVGEQTQKSGEEAVTAARQAIVDNPLAAAGAAFAAGFVLSVLLRR